MNLTDLLREAVVKGDFVGTSGKKLSWYCDVRRVLLSEYLYKVCIAVYNRTKELQFDSVITAGVGGTVLLGGLQGFLLSNKRGSVYRMVKKEHGLQKQVEGDLREGDKVLLLDDVLTTGGTLKQMMAVVREVGAIPIAVVVVLDRSESPVVLDIPIFACITSKELGLGYSHSEIIPT